MTTFHEKGWNFFHENLSKGNPLDYVLEYMPENKGNFFTLNNSLIRSMTPNFFTVLNHNASLCAI